MGHVLCTAWSPDGRYFASADKRGTLIIWDPHQKRKRVIKQQNGTKSEPTEPIWIKSQAHKQYITGLAWEPLHLNQGRGEASSNNFIWPHRFHRGCEVGR